MRGWDGARRRTWAPPAAAPRPRTHPCLWGSDMGMMASSGVHAVMRRSGGNAWVRVWSHEVPRRRVHRRWTTPLPRRAVHPHARLHRHRRCPGDARGLSADGQAAVAAQAAAEEGAAGWAALRRGNAAAFQITFLASVVLWNAGCRAATCGAMVAPHAEQRATSVVPPHFHRGIQKKQQRS